MGCLARMNFHKANWSELTHAYGDASDVPQLIQSIQSSDEDEREEALDELYSNIWHQGTVYEATVKALPVLLELYIKKKVIDLDGLAFLIILIADGKGYHQVHSQEENGSEIIELIRNEQEVVAQIRDIFEPNLALFLPYLEHENDDIRSNAACMFSQYPAHATITIPKIQSALKKEVSEEVITHLEDCIEELKNYNGPTK